MDSTPVQQGGGGGGLGALFLANRPPGTGTGSPHTVGTTSPASTNTSTPPKAWDAETLRTVNVRDLQAQVRDMEARRSLLRSELTSLTPDDLDKTLPSALTPSLSPLPTRKSSSSSSTSSNTRQSQTLLSSYRIASGITAFSVRSPNPPYHTRYGFRIDNCSENTFLAPHYIICNIHPITHLPSHSPTTTSSSFLVLAHATLPPHVNLQALARKYLPVPPGYSALGKYEGTGDGDEAARFREWRQDVSGLVGEVRSRVVWWNRRGEMLRRVKERCSGGNDNGGGDGDDVDDGEDEEVLPEQPLLEDKYAEGGVMGPPTRVEWDAGNENVVVTWCRRRRVAEGEEQQKAKEEVVLEARIRLEFDGKVVKCVARRGEGRVKIVERRLKVSGLKVLGA
ncbi:hypothetical protein DFH27DRAFT_650343 [Peziza echinospora]|nr:hypothetical protein DFH27DRAFT_650343 [Peziza echinospora]